MSPCRSCSAKCCRYVALQIDTPKSKHDFENIRWYLAHKDVEIFINKRKWFLDITTDCKYLTKSHACSIYEKRPEICRSHENYECEYWDDSFHHDYHFKSLEEFDAYVRKRFRNRKKPKNKK